MGTAGYQELTLPISPYAVHLDSLLLGHAVAVARMLYDNGDNISSR